MSQPLEGIRVIDWTIWQQGPVATAMLGDLGADVIKIEDRRGDPARGMSRIAGLSTKSSPGNFYFDTNNHNKRSLTVDLAQDAGKELIYRLVKTSDVLVHNFRRGVPERIGLDYATLSKHNPKLIYATASGYGPKGPDSAAPAFDRCGLARSGIMSTLGEPDMPPLMMMGGIADQTGAIMLSYAVLAALIARERLGIGQEVDVSQLGSMIHLQALNVAASLDLGQALPRKRRAEEGNPLSNHYQCKDGKWISFAMLQADRYWPTLCQAMGMHQYEKDPRFATMDKRSQNSKEIIPIMDRVFATKTRDEWMKQFQKAGGDLIYAPVNDINDVIRDPQVLENGYIADFDHPARGKVKMVGMPLHFSKTPAGIRLPAPELGQHTEEILLELGYNWDNITNLKDEGIV
ncbi:MAG: CoA transferase [Dehalococcoidia bacterium]|nr:CoA transferase [Dehalococcoidia bacterium]